LRLKRVNAVRLPGDIQAGSDKNGSGQNQGHEPARHAPTMVLVRCLFFAVCIHGFFPPAGLRSFYQ
jgi:hypothetical protein